MPTSVPPAAAPNSGIKTSSSGDRHIPQSVRGDGTVRREIKIRPGYRPPEDVEVYKNRTAEAWKTRGSGGVPGADGIKDSPEPAEGSKGKNAKRREARKKAKAADGGEGLNGVDGDHADPSLNDGQQPKTALDSQPSDSLVEPAMKANKPKSPIVPESDGQQQKNAEPDEEKQARNLKKKLRQARELKDKKESGESLLPEQFAKVIKIQELVRQLDALGFDSDGNKRAEKTP
ncbi:MAG: hypothetical protein OHK93_001076 [Ramalina farinacea]|uniref:WIBG Mago-binding domain-containing protein n=1 Tax=Ramalina farinacea TaxID=258253 RepID=A0AA43QPR8_9LECA|nr:hypothetical protein [Ramalina farinacea]